MGGVGSEVWFLAVPEHPAHSSPGAALLLAGVALARGKALSGPPTRLLGEQLFAEPGLV